MRWLLFLAGLALGAAFALLAWALECRACDRSVPIAPIGAAAYLTLLAGAIWRGPHPLVFAGVFLAFGVHAFLVVRMIQTAWCWICAVAAANALGLAVLAILLDRSNLKVAGFALPWSSLILLLLPRSAEPAPRFLAVHEPGQGVRVLVLEREQCPYCVELRERVIPRLREEFGDRITISFRSADDFPGVTKTPTVIVTRPRDARVIEGLPPYEMLRRAVEEALVVRP